MLRQGVEKKEIKKRPSKSFFSKFTHSRVDISWDLLLIPLLVGGIFYILEKVLDVVLGRIFRRKPK